MTAMNPQPIRTPSLARLLRPRTLAVFGGQSAAELIRQSEKLGFAGDIWPVHPHHAHIAGRPAFRSLADLPAAPDAAFLGVNRHASIDLIGALSRIGCGGVVAYASGYAEAGDEGRILQTRLLHAAGAMPLFGPNCYGFINYLDRALVWPDQFGGAPVDRGVAIITQSGNIGLNITMQRRGLPVGYLITLGNQAGTGHAAAIQAVLDDPRVTAIGLHMEGLGDPQALADAVARAHAQGIPVVALKTGRSEAGAQMALSHTASLASRDSVVDAFFSCIGVARVASIPALLETLKLLHVQGKLPGRSIASLSCSGGEAALIADSAAAFGLHFAPLSEAAHADIAATLPDLVHVSNPLDYHTFGWRNRAALAATFAAMMRAGADLNLLILDFPRPDACETADWDIAADALRDAASATGRRAAVLATLPEAMPEPHAQHLADAGIVPLAGMAEALQAIAAAADCARPVAHHQPRLLAGLPAPGGAQTLSELDGKRRLATFDVPVPAGGAAQTETEAVAIAAQIGFPVVVKALGADIAHKTERGGVKLNLSSPAAVQEAARTLLPLTGAVLVERMVQGPVAELIVGIARDAVLGPYLMLGSGGILAELVGDTATLLLPATRDEIALALRGLRAHLLLTGHRNTAPADIDAAIDAILHIQEFAMAHLHSLIELDVNPLIVCRTGAVAADVLLRVGNEAANV